MRTPSRAGKFELRRVDELVGEAHHRQHDRVLDHFDGRQVLRVAQDELGDADAARLADRLAQQRVRALAALGRHQVVRRLEEAIVDLVGLDEVDDVDGARLLERRRLEVLLRQDDEVALLVLVALDEVFPGDRMAVAHADALELHRRLVLRVQHAEARAVIAHRRVQLDRDVDEAERDRSFPERSCHGCVCRC